MQSVSSMIWTRASVSISYDDNRFTTSTILYKIKKKGSDNNIQMNM